MSVADILQEMAQNAGRVQQQRGALIGQTIAGLSAVPGQILDDRERQAVLDANRARQAQQDAYARDTHDRQVASDARDQAAAVAEQTKQTVLRGAIAAGWSGDDTHPANLDVRKSVKYLIDAGHPELAPTITDFHDKLQPKLTSGAPGSVMRNPDGSIVPNSAIPPTKPDYTVNGQRFSGDGTPLGALVPTQTAPKSLESKSMLVDGKPTTVNFDPASGKYVLPGTTAAAPDHAGDPSWTRADGTPKGNGFLGVLKRPDGTLSSEISIGVTIGGQEVEVPTLVPTLTSVEKNWLLTHDISDPSTIPMPIQQKAVDFAKTRIAAGKSPFAGPEDSPAGPGSGGIDVSTRVRPIPPAAAGASPTALNDVKESVAGMMDGTLPPMLPGRATKEYLATMAEAHRQGFDLQGAVTDWNATQKHIASMNGAQQLRLNQAINSLPDMLDSVDSLASQWKGGRFPILNKANLALAKGGAYGAEVASVANQLDAQIADVTADLGNVYMGGNSPTEQALKLAGKSLNGEWDETVLHNMVGLARKNVTIRHNSIKNTGVSGASDNNPYGTQAASGAAPAKRIVYDLNGNPVK
jgi:hypothetical protein